MVDAGLVVLMSGGCGVAQDLARGSVRLFGARL